MGGVVIIEFLGWRAKMYSILATKTNKKTVKGILTIGKEKEIYHEDFRTALFSEEQMTHKQTRIVQKEHELFTVISKKTLLSPFNDKKWVTKDGNRFKTHSFGHHKILEHEIEDRLVGLLNDK